MTADELRISDWSSDVCSSDLTHAEWPPREARNPCLDPVGRSWLPDLLRAGPAAQGRDQVAQLHPGMEQARLDRPDGALKDGGDLVEAVADDVDQFDDHSLVGAQVLEGPVQQVTQFSILVRDRKSTRLNSSH